MANMAWVCRPSISSAQIHKNALELSVHTRAMSFGMGCAVRLFIEDLGS